MWVARCFRGMTPTRAVMQPSRLSSTVPASFVSGARGSVDAGLVLRDVSRLAEQGDSALEETLLQTSQLPSGVRFLIGLRGAVLDSKSVPIPAVVDRTLHKLLSTWFVGGCLHTMAVEKTSPLPILEKIIQYEQVHRISDMNALHQRLGPARRIFALMHSAMPNDPVAFVEVALVPEVSSSIQEILSQHTTPGDAEKARGAIMYSISAAQHRGLQGIPVGGFLIKQAAASVKDDLGDRLQFVCTLSPIPGFASWLAKLSNDSQVPDVHRSEANRILKQIQTGQTPTDDLRNAIQRLCARYLCLEKRAKEGALDPVANFHLRNGAYVYRLNWLGDVSAKGLKQSAGMMVNYMYDFDQMHRNSADYIATGAVKTSDAVKTLLPLTAHL